MRNRINIGIYLGAILLIAAIAFPVAASRARWRTASATELKVVIPGRAPVMKENIETEMRTASGVTDGQGKFIAGAVMITAGYSADGKFSHFFVTQVPIKIGSMQLRPDDYVLGYQRVDNETVKVTFYRASSGDVIGEIDAHPNRKGSMVRSFLITPPVSGKGGIQIGRFLFNYSLWD